MRSLRRILCLSFAALGGFAPLQAIPVTGTVTTPDGLSLAGARAELASVASHFERARGFLDGRPEPPAAASAVSDADGRFVLEAPGPGLYSVTVRAPGRIGVELVPLALTEPHELPPARLEADAGATVEVRDAAGEPVSGAWVLARRSGSGRERGFAPALRLARTGPRGTAALPRAAGERLDVGLWVADRGFLDERRGVTGAVFEVPRAASGERTVEVRGEGGEPLAGVVVAVGGLAWPAGATDEAGRLLLPASGAAPFDIQLVAEDGRRGQATLTDSSASVLSAPTVARGRVLRQADRLPVRGALVWPALDPGAFSFSDAEGRYLLMAPAESRLSVQAAGFLPARIEPPSAEVLLEPARPASGRVVDSGMHPLAGVEVTIAPSGGHGEGLLAATGDDGRFRVSHLPAERVDLLAQRRGYAPTLARGVRASRSGAPRPAAAGAGPVPAIDLGTLILVPGAAIHGRVRDASGEPVTGAGVWLSADLELPAADLLAVAPEGPPAARTDTAGTFAVEDLEPGSRAHLRIAGDGFLPVALAAVTAPTREPLRVVLERAGAVHGRVSDEDGAAVAGAAVTLRPPPLTGRLELPLIGPEHRHETVTGADGRFSFDTVAAGTFEISLDAEGFVSPEPREVKVTADGRPPEVAFVLARGATLRGRVTDTGGGGVDGARIFVADASGATDADGLYVVAGIPPGRHEARVRHPVLNQAAAEIEITDGENVHDFVLDASRRVEGRVADADGAPVAGARVVFAQQDLENRHQVGALTGDDGGFALPRVADGRYLVSAWKAGYAFTELPAPVTVAGAPLEGVDVVLPRGTVIRGRVLGLEPEELAGVRIEASRPGSPSLAGLLDYDGAFEIADAGAGDWLLVATTPERDREARARVAVRPGGREVERDLEFGGGYTLDGLVLFGGEPLAGARVSLTADGIGLERQVFADHEGAFRLLDLPRATYRLAVSHPRELLVANRQVAVPDDGPVTIRFESAKVYGDVRSVEGLPLPGALVVLQQVLDDGEGGSLYSVNADREGYFALPRLAAGRYRIRVRLDGYEELEDEAELAAGVETGPLRYELRPTAGLTFQLAADRPRPLEVTVTVADAEGRPLQVESRSVDAAGRVTFPTLPAGTWDLIVSAPGAVPRPLTVTVPSSEPVPLDLEPGGRLQVRVPDLAESGRAADEQVAALRLLDAAGAPLLTLNEEGVPGRVWGLAGGTATVDGVPPGQWTVRVETADGRTWSAQVSPGQSQVLLDAVSVP